MNFVRVVKTPRLFLNHYYILQTSHLSRLLNNILSQHTFICPSPSPPGRKVGTRAWTPPFGAMLGGVSASCADPDLQRAARSERTAMQPRNPHMRQSSDNGKNSNSEARQANCVMEETAALDVLERQRHGVRVGWYTQQ